MDLHADYANYSLSGFKIGRILTGLANVSHDDDKKERIDTLPLSGLTCQTKAVEISSCKNSNNIIKINHLR
jgi:hypothetical protein